MLEEGTSFYIIHSILSNAFQLSFQMEGNVGYVAIFEYRLNTMSFFMTKNYVWTMFKYLH